MIAETTATYSTTASQRNVFLENGFNLQWLSRRDGKVRDTHKKADGDRPNQFGYFQIGSDQMKHPGGGSEAKENVNCRCYLLPVKI